MFWGLVLEPYKKYTQKVAQTFHISQAALDVKSADQEPVQLIVEYENSNFVLATLSRKVNIFQVPLDLIFKAGDQVSFRTIGNGKIHLSGYHVLDDLDSILVKGEEESDYDEVEVEENKKKRKNINLSKKGGKKVKLTKSNNEDESCDSDNEEKQYLSKNAIKIKNKKINTSSINQGKEEEDEEEDDDDDDDGGDDDDDDDDDDDINEDEDFDNYEEEEDEEDNEEEDDDEEEDENEEDLDLIDEENEEELELDADDLDSEEDNDLSKEYAIKNSKTDKKIVNSSNKEAKTKTKSFSKLNQTPEENKKSIPKKDVKTPKCEKKNEKHNKSTIGEITPKKKGLDDFIGKEKTPKTPKAESSGEKKVLEGGVTIEEIKVGTGAVAKPGKMVNVYYVGTLHSTKKQFDSVQHGPGFKFILGKNEVIKGWDIGLNGMKVGGIRKLIIPPYLAYGTKGSPPVIPPNSTLTFTVELRSIS